MLGDSFSLPPKRILVTSFIPSAWVDDHLINERKVGLAAYLNSVLQSSDQREKPAVTDFLTSSSTAITGEFNYEDALPSTLSRKTALEAQAKIATATPIAAAYHPAWVVDSWPPENLDYSKFDILFFGM